MPETCPYSMLECEEYLRLCDIHEALLKLARETAPSRFHERLIIYSYAIGAGDERQKHLDMHKAAGK